MLLEERSGAIVERSRSLVSGGCVFEDGYELGHVDQGTPPARSSSNQTWVLPSYVPQRSVSFSTR